MVWVVELGRNMYVRIYIHTHTHTQTDKHIHTCLCELEYARTLTHATYISHRHIYHIGTYILTYLLVGVGVRENTLVTRVVLERLHLDFIRHNPVMAAHVITLFRLV